MIRIGIDIGGTFTDFVVYDSEDSSLSTFKLPSTPDNPADAVLQGLGRITGSNRAVIIHGSTVATNTLLERQGAKTALVATKGFKDIIQIGRQNRPSLYDWSSEPSFPLVTTEMRYEIDERVEHSGVVSKPIEKDEIDALLRLIQPQEPDSVAICFLYSFLYPQHEEAIANILREAGYFVSCSNEVLPEFREYERCSTTVINAYVTPKLASYLSVLQNGIPDNQIQVMQSNGGMINISEAEKFGARCILSGPAGGVVGATYIAKELPYSIISDKENIKLITFDMGGTSTDVALINGKPKLSKELTVGGMPIALPMLDIHTIGAGGGSIAKIDLAGALRVGPESAGANPGPACYGRGDLATVTDANLVLGRILPEEFLGGKMKLDMHRAQETLESLAMQLNLEIEQTALGIIEVINAHMERAIRVSSVEKGYDPSNFSLMTFGGAGGLHATSLARKIGIPRVIVPPIASTLSAFGMLTADFIKDYSQTVMVVDTDRKKFLAEIIQALKSRGLFDLTQAGFLAEQIQFEPSVDMRYKGQSYELNIPFSETLEQDFVNSHQMAYGYQRKNSQTEIVTIRLRAIGLVDKPHRRLNPSCGANSSRAFRSFCPVVYLEGERQVPFYQGELLDCGNTIEGPAVILRADTTILLNDHDKAEVDEALNLVIRLE